MKKSKNVALVLSGGAARGLVHIGVIEELITQGYNIHSISGTSMGALIGGVYALGKLDEFKSWILSLDKLKIIQLLDFTWSSPGLIKGKKVLEKIKSFIPEKDIEDLEINFTAIATEITKKEVFVFNSGNIYDAIRASISIPALFTPIKKDKLILVDGGLVNNIPLNHVNRKPNDLLIASHVNANIPVGKKFLLQNYKFKEPKQKKKSLDFKEHLKVHFKNKKKEQIGFFDIIYKSMFIAVDEISSMRIQKDPPDILIQTSHDVCGLFDFLSAERLIELGRETTRNQLQIYNS